MSAYVRAEHREDLGRDKVEYGKVSDARILYTAYQEDSILVTNNVKDFLLYPLLFSQKEERLYGMEQRSFIIIPPDGYKKIHKDLVFKAMLNEFYELESKAEET